MSRRVTRAERARDLLAAMLLTGGAALYAYAYAGMRTLAAQRETAGQALWASLRRFDYYWTMSRVGLVILAAGLAVMAWSFWRHVRRREAHPS